LNESCNMKLLICEVSQSSPNLISSIHVFVKKRGRKVCLYMGQPVTLSKCFISYEP
jgi:hypothetical protein